MSMKEDEGLQTSALVVASNQPLLTTVFLHHPDVHHLSHHDPVQRSHCVPDACAERSEKVLEWKSPFEAQTKAAVQHHTSPHFRPGFLSLATIDILD